MKDHGLEPVYLRQAYLNIGKNYPETLDKLIDASIKGEDTTVFENELFENARSHREQNSNTR